MSIRWFRSLRTEGTALLLGFVVAVELVYAYAAVSALRETMGQVASERLEDARSMAQRFDVLFALGRERLSAVAEQPGLALWLAAPAVRSLPPGAAIPQRETLHYLFFRSEVFSGLVAVVTRDGALLWSEPYDAERVAARLHVDYPPLRDAMVQRRSQISNLPLPWRPRPAAVLVQPIVDLGGEPVGAVLGEIMLGASKLAGFLGEPRFGSDTLAALVDEKGELVVGSPRAQVLFRADGSLPTLGSTATLTADATRWLVARAPLRDVPWSVLLAQDDREAFAPLRALEWRLVLIGLLLGATAIGFSLVVLGRVVKPLEVLTSAASAVAEGDFERPVPAAAPGELGALSWAFHRMRNDLRATVQGLRESEERYRRSVDSANDAIFAVDPVTLEVLHANRKAAETTGSLDVAGRSFLDFHPLDHRQRALEFLARVTSAGEGTLPDIDLFCHGGTRLPVSISASMIVHGAGRFVQLICRDLSERKRMERELVQAEKLSTVGVLAAGILHELNTPLAYIQANLESLGKIVQALPDGSAARALRTGLGDALEGAQSASTIVRDLRIFARSREDATETFDVNDAVRMALRMAQHELKYRATVMTELGEVPQVLGKATDLSQVFLNLIVNAAHAIPPGNVQQNRVRVVTEVAGGRAIARVSDTGDGIPPEALPHIFEPFYTTKPEGVGTGLGLAISRDILRRVGGEIRVESTVGVGTTFIVEIPLAPAA